MPKSAIITLALLGATTAADLLRGPFNGQSGQGRRNETIHTSHNALQSTPYYGSVLSSSSKFSASPETSSIPPSTTSHASYGFAPTGTSPPSRSPRPSGKPRPSVNGTCHGTTVNIVGASLDWWFTETTYTQVDSTFLIQVNSNDSSTGWTLLPATKTFDVTSAVANPSCKSSTAFNPKANATMLQYSCVDTPTPVAAVTTTVEQTAYLPVNATSSKGAIPNVATSPTPAAITVANANGSSTYAAGTPFVHFSQYDLVSKRPFLYGDGRVGCAETTQVHTMSTPGSFKYTGGDVNGSYAAVGGDVHPDVLGIVGQLNATAGSFVAEPTVVVVVHKVLAAQRMFAMMIQPAGGELETPEATLPPSISTVRETPTETGIIWSPLAVHVESSQSFLAVPTRSTPTSRKAAVTTKAMPVIVPFVAHLEDQDLTLAMPVNPNRQQAVITALFNGATVTATAVGNGRQGPEQPQNGGNGIQSPGQSPQGGGGSQSSEPPSQGGVGRVLSAVMKAAQASHAAPGGVGDAMASVIGVTAGTGGQQSDGATVGKEGQQNNGAQNKAGSAENAGVVTIGSSVLPVSASNGPNGPALVIDGKTVTPGGAAVTIDGTRISVAQDATAVVVGSSTIHLAPTSNPGAIANIPLITLGTKTWTANAATQFNIAGTILTPGGTAVAFGSTITLAPSAGRVIVDGKTQDLSPPVITPAPQLTIGGTVYRPNVDNTYDVGSQILTRGGQVVASGTTISLAADGSSLLVDGLAQPIGSGDLNPGKYATITAPPILHLDGKAFAANGGASYVISGKTLTPGGVVTFTGSQGEQTVSLNSAVNKVIRISDGYMATSAIGMIGAAPGGAPILTIDGEEYSAQDYEVGRGATYMIDGQTLTPDGKITISGEDGPETISLLAAGTAIISAHAGATTTSSISGAYGVMPTNAPILTVDGETFTAINDGATYIIDGQTITPGGSDTVTINHHAYQISLSPHATMLEVERLGADGKVVSTKFTLFPAQMPSTTIYNTEQAERSTATRRVSLDDGAAPTEPAERERPKKGMSSALRPIFGMLSLSVLALLF